MPRPSAQIAPALFAVLLAACSSGAAPCLADRDCFAGELCREGVCAPGNRTTPDAGEADATAGPPTDQPDQSTDSPATRDAGHADLGGDAVQMDTSTPSGGAACVVDPFTFTCSDDDFEPNDQWLDGHRLASEVVGCNQDFAPLEIAYVARMCPRDGSDYYSVNFSPCETAGYVIEWQVQPESDCDPALIGLESFSWDCEEPFVECVTIDGKPTVRMIVEPGNFQNLQSMYVQVHSRGARDVTFDYRISLRVRQ